MPVEELKTKNREYRGSNIREGARERDVYKRKKKWNANDKKHEGAKPQGVGGAA